MNWLPDMDLNHDKQIQSLLCYRYTIPHRVLLREQRGYPGILNPPRKMARSTEGVEMAALPPPRLP